MDKVKKILIVSSDSNLKDVLNFCFDGWGYEVFLKDPSPSSDIEEIKKVSPDIIVIDVQTASKEQLDICRNLKKDFTTAFIPVITLINKRHLRSQLLNLEQGVDDYLIKPPDPLDLRIRIEMSIRRAKHSIHASPLTGLPGGKILEDVLKEKLSSGKPFSFAYVDIDNFKSFNDIYGYRKGDKVILQTAYLLFTTLKSFGNNDDFISHIGGDDFAFITSPDKYETVCKNFINFFDSIVPFHYSNSDRAKGFVMARDRAREIKKSPLMSVSIAVFNKDDFSKVKSIIEVNERIAEIKRFLKTIPESIFMAERRDSVSFADKLPQVSKRTPAYPYQPLGQILLANKVISHEQLDEALGLHWKKGIVLGEVLRELGFVGDQQIQEALSVQRKRVNLSDQALKN
ncbi:MAG: diguanylate cyclase [Candidatus Omnitrophica bacterium]|nr:diguanylate cyclase [Candidatus Omnitrophota bacterium]